MPSAAKKFATALLAGAVMVSGAWACASLVPVDEKQVTAADKAGPEIRATKAKAAPTPAAEPPEDAAALPRPARSRLAA